MSRPGRRSTAGLGLALALCGLAVTGCNPKQSDTGASAQVKLGFDEQGSFASNSGTADVVVRVVAEDGGELRQERRGLGYALRLPSYNPSAQPPRAGLVITGAGGEDPLNPGDAVFSFGADIRLDTDSQGSLADNGDNVLQRGLHDDPTQFKLQADNDRPSCTVKGDAGEVSVASSRQIEPLAWYSVSCRRTADKLSITVTRQSDGETWTDSTGRSSGTVTFTDEQRTSIGVKLTSTGRVPLSADQFNGDIDNAFIDIDH